MKRISAVGPGLTRSSSSLVMIPFLPFHAQFRAAFPDIEVVVEDQIAEGDMVATRCSVRGKHAGDSLGFAATQAPVDFTGVTITRIKDGKIVEAWNNFDFMRMYKQLGAI